MAKNGHARSGHNSGSLWLTRSYNFVDKDPEIDVFRTAFRKTRIKEADLAVLAGLAPTTVKNMFGGATMWPQHRTYMKIAGAIGCTYELIEAKEINFEKEIPKAREQYKEHKAALERKRRREAAKK